MEFKPKRFGAPMINCVCSECGAYFSEERGHSCGEDANSYY